MLEDTNSLDWAQILKKKTDGITAFCSAVLLRNSDRRLRLLFREMNHISTVLLIMLSSFGIFGMSEGFQEDRNEPRCSK